MRAMLEALPSEVDVVLIVRASAREDLVLHNELCDLVAARGGVVHELLGSRDSVRFDERVLAQIVPDIDERDLYVCGPEGFASHFASAARRLGVPDERIHREAFAF